MERRETLEKTDGGEYFNVNKDGRAFSRLEFSVNGFCGAWPNLGDRPILRYYPLVR